MQTNTKSMKIKIPLCKETLDRLVNPLYRYKINETTNSLRTLSAHVHNIRSITFDLVSTPTRKPRLVRCVLTVTFPSRMAMALAGMWVCPLTLMTSLTPQHNCYAPLNALFISVRNLWTGVYVCAVVSRQEVKKFCEESINYHCETVGRR